MGRRLSSIILLSVASLPVSCSQVSYLPDFPEKSDLINRELEKDSDEIVQWVNIHLRLETVPDASFIELALLPEAGRLEAFNYAGKSPLIKKLSFTRKRSQKDFFPAGYVFRIVAGRLEKKASIAPYCFVLDGETHRYFSRENEEKFSDELGLDFNYTIKVKFPEGQFQVPVERQGILAGR